MNSRMTQMTMALLVLVTCACAKIRSDEVDNDTFYGYYGVTYSEQDGRNSYSVRYAVGGSTGTTVELVSPSRIQVNGMEMSLFDSVVAGYEYSYSVSGAYVGEPVTFVWTRDDGTEKSNTITPVKAVAVTSPASGASHSRSANLVVTVSGEALASGESFVAELQSLSSSGSETSWMYRSISSGTQITFAAADLASFQTGSARLTVRREKSVDPQMGHEKKGGIMISKYIAAPLSLTINP